MAYKALSKALKRPQTRTARGFPHEKRPQAKVTTSTRTLKSTIIMGKGSGSGRRAVASDGPRIGEDGSALIGGGSFLERTQAPSWIKDREEAYERIAARRAEERAMKTPTDIFVTMPDGKVLTENPKSGVKFQSWTTTPYDVAASISQGLADSVVVARITYADYASDYDPQEDGVGGKDIMEEAEEEEPASFQDDDCCGEDKDPNAAIKATLWDLSRPLGRFIFELLIPSRFNLLTFNPSP